MLIMLMCQILRYSPRQEQDNDNRCRDPERSVQIRVSVQDIQEVGAGIHGSDAATNDFVGVYVEELAVVLDCPQMSLSADIAPRSDSSNAAAAARRPAIVAKEGLGVGLDFGAARVVFKVFSILGG